MESKQTIYSSRSVANAPNPFIGKLKVVLFIFIILVFGGILFVKFDTPDAAKLTDNVLRPLFGDKNIVALEQIYYNLADGFLRLTYNRKSLGSPILDVINSESGQVVTGGNLELTPIKIDSNFTPDQNEGVWINKPLTLFPHQEVVAYTFVRPDLDRAYAYVTLVKLDMKVLRLGAVAGQKQPGGPAGNSGPGVIPSDLINSGNLVAAFDGGFQYRDGEYGMIVGNKTYLPLKKDIGTLIGYQDGTLKIVNYTGQDLGQNIAFIRQNCPILVETGRISILNEDNKKLWGRTFSSGIVTWRSGLGVTSNGNLIYAVGNNLTPLSLATALKSAGAVGAIQLDINPFWVRFNFFNPTGKGTYSSKPLTRNLSDGSKEYLHGFSKDFFYVYKN